MVKEETGRLSDLMRQSAATTQQSGSVIPVDTSDVDFDGNQVGLIPNGTWCLCSIVKATLGATNSKMDTGVEAGKKPKIDVEFVVEDGPWKKRHIWKMYLLVGKSAAMFLALCDAIDQYDKTNKQPTATEASLINQQLWLLIDVQEGTPKDSRFPDGEHYKDRNIVSPWQSHEHKSSRSAAEFNFGDPAVVIKAEEAKVAELEMKKGSVKKDWGDEEEDK